MRFDIHGRYRLEIRRDGDAWTAYRIGDGKRRKESELVIPASVSAADLPVYLDDLLHELAQPGSTIRRID